VKSRFLSALFPSAAPAQAAAEVLERRGAVLLAMETEPGATPQPLREPASLGKDPMMLDPVLLSRLQFAFTVSFHTVFPTMSIGLAAFLVLVE
jgi:hypothetical protein